MVSMHNLVLPKKLDITMRPRTKTEYVAKVVEDGRLLVECPQLRSRKLRRGKDLRGEEWEEFWEEGVRF